MESRSYNWRAVAIAERLSTRLDEILTAVPPIKAPAAYWLNSDCGPSYCWDCARVARGREFDLGPILFPGSRYRRDDWDEAFYDGIDGGFDTTSDSAQACDTCGATLSYILTDDGVANELGYYLDQPLAVLRAEDSYALDRLTLNIYAESPRHMLVAAAAVINQAWRLMRAPDRVAQ